MRKLFFAICLCCALGAYERHNIFVGAGAGISDNFLGYNRHIILPHWSLLGGYEYKPLREIGVMVYLESIMGIKPAGLETTINMQVAFKTDVAFEFSVNPTFRLGPFVGIGFGYAREDKAIAVEGSAHKALMLINAGLQSNINESNIVRFALSLPINLTAIGDDLDLVHITLAYAYKF